MKSDVIGTGEKPVNRVSNAKLRIVAILLQLVGVIVIIVLCNEGYFSLHNTMVAIGLIVIMCGSYVMGCMDADKKSDVVNVDELVTSSCGNSVAIRFEDGKWVKFTIGEKPIETSRNAEAV